jgi:hypothetical protein
VAVEWGAGLDHHEWLVAARPQAGGDELHLTLTAAPGAAAVDVEDPQGGRNLSRVHG